MVQPAKIIAHYHVSLKEYHGICVLPLHPDDLVSHGLYILEALLVDQAVDQDEALAVLDVEIPHGRELLRPRRVQDLQHRRRRIHLDLLAVRSLRWSGRTSRWRSRSQTGPWERISRPLRCPAPPPYYSRIAHGWEPTWRA